MFLMILEFSLQIVALVAPYVLCAAAGAYLESKYGSTAKAQVAAIEAELKALKAKLP